jgi:cytochrome c-type biogenesis protein
MDSLFATLNGALGGAWPLAMLAALGWGVVSVILSPCHLGTIPLIVGAVSGDGNASERGRGARFAFAFAFGMLVAIAIIGLLVIGAGFAVAGIARYTNYFVALVFVVAGLNLAGILPLPLSGLRITAIKSKGVGAAALLGLVFGIGLSPCTFAFLAPILGVALGTATRSPALGYVLLLLFGVGHCAVIGFFGGSAEVVQRYLNWNKRSRGLVALKLGCAVCLLGAASYLVYVA